MCCTSWATATLETVARPMWLSGMRNVVATGLSTPIWWRTRVRSGVVAGSISQISSNGVPRHGTATSSLGEPERRWAPAVVLDEDRASSRWTRRAPPPRAGASPVPRRRSVRPSSRAASSIASIRRPGDALPSSAGVDPEAPDLARRRPWSRARTPTPPTGGPAASPRRATTKAPAGGSNMAAVRPRSLVVEDAVARHELRLGLRHHPPRARRRRRARRASRMAVEGRCIPSILSDVAGAPVPAAQRPPLPCSHPSPPTSTSSPSSRPNWPAGRRTASSSAPSSSARAPSRGSSTRARRRPTACPACTTSGPGSTRTSSAASAPWTAPTWPAGPAGTPTGCRSRSRWRRSSASRARSRSSRRSASPSSPGCAASPSTPTSTSSPA